MSFIRKLDSSWDGLPNWAKNVLGLLIVLPLVSILLLLVLVLPSRSIALTIYGTTLEELAGTQKYIVVALCLISLFIIFRGYTLLDKKRRRKKYIERIRLYNDILTVHKRMSASLDKWSQSFWLIEIRWMEAVVKNNVCYHEFDERRVLPMNELTMTLPDSIPQNPLGSIKVPDELISKDSCCRDFAVSILRDYYLDLQSANNRDSHPHYKATLRMCFNYLREEKKIDRQIAIRIPWSEKQLEDGYNNLKN